MGFHEYTRHTCLPNAALGSPSHLPPDIRPLWFLSKFGGGSFTFADTPRELEKRERERRHLCESVYIYIYVSMLADHTFYSRLYGLEISWSINVLIMINSVIKYLLLSLPFYAIFPTLDIFN